MSLDWEFQFKKGRKSELIVLRWLKSKGFFVESPADYSGRNAEKAPMLQGNGKSYRLPDHKCVNAETGEQFWAEVKYKDRPWYPLKDKAFIHGIELPAFSDYKMIAKIFRCPIYLFLHEGCTGAILRLDLTNATPALPKAATTMPDGAEMVNFFRRDFEEVARIKPAGSCGFLCRKEPHGGSVIVNGARISLDEHRRDIEPIDVCPLLNPENDAIWWAGGYRSVKGVA